MESQFTATNCWIVAPAAGEQCVVIDPGIGIEREVQEVIDANALHPVAVILTHGHLDHTFSVTPVCQARGIPAYIHAADENQLRDPWTWTGMPKGMPMFGGLTYAEPDDVKLLADGEQLALAGLDLTVRHAPGHTEGSILFDLAPITGDDEPTTFSGDVLFAGSIGRTDLPGGSMPAMMTSLRDVILPKDDAVVVHPGHGPSTTIGRERRTNPFLRQLT